VTRSLHENCHVRFDWTFQYETFCIHKRVDSDFHNFLHHSQIAVESFPVLLQYISNDFRSRSARRSDALVRAKVLNNCDVHSVIVVRLLQGGKLRIAHPRLQTMRIRFLDRMIAINIEDNKEKTNFSVYSLNLQKKNDNHQKN